MNVITVIDGRRIFGRSFVRLEVVEGHLAGKRFWIRVGNRRLNRQVARHLKGSWSWADRLDHHWATAEEVWG